MSNVSIITSIEDRQYVSPLNKSLRVFFRQALRITLRHPALALEFYRTVRAQKRSAVVRAKYLEQGITVPPIIIYSITNRCNLRCKGCYHHNLRASEHNEMSGDKMLSVIQEASELGVSFMVLAGGEPLVRRELPDIIKRFPDIIFFVFTNGLLIDDAMIARLKQQRNMVPIISLEGQQADTDDRRGEGVFEHLAGTLEKLHKAGIFYGTSLTVTRNNFTTVTDNEFVKNLTRKGCRLFFFVEYTPIQPGTSEWEVTEDQRIALPRLSADFHSRYPALFVALPGDEKDFGGCLSAGRGFVHINANGDVEPCPFAPYSDTNVRNSTLKEALQSRLLKAIRENQDRLDEAAGACALWKEREWVAGLTRRPEEVLISK